MFELRQNKQYGRATMISYQPMYIIQKKITSLPYSLHPLGSGHQFFFPITTAPTMALKNNTLLISNGIT